MPETIDDLIVDDRLLDDRRDTCRMPQPGGIGMGKLRIGSKTVSVKLLDESAGGFMVSADNIPKISPTQPVELISVSGRHQLRVVWRRAVDGETRLGLQRLSEELAWRDESSWVVWMLIAIILGFGIGYFVAFKDQNVARKLKAFTTSKVIVNDVTGGSSPPTSD